MATAIDTGKVTGRRSLHFNSLDDILADVEHLAASPGIKTLGNWSAGQTFEHLATNFNKSIDGFDNLMPVVVRVVFRTLMKKQFLIRPMSAGFKLPAKSLKELVPDATSFETGLQDIRQAIRRLQTETKRSLMPVLGPLTVDEWNQLHCRHAELHLSFLTPVDS
jgi:Protein of unknown function (DUF1569)